MNNFNINKLWNFVLILILGICLFLWNKTKNEKDNFNSLNKKIEIEKQKSNLIIKQKQDEIDSLNINILKQKNKLTFYQNKIDKLSTIKKSIKTNLANRIVEINDFDAEKLENYFYEELK
jgi:hypothetical protein